MTTVVDLFTRQAVSCVRTPQELAELGRITDAPEFIKKRGRMVLTEETRDETLALFDAFGLQLDESVPPDTMLNTWAWLGSKVATALFCYERGEFDVRIRTHYPVEFCDYVLALVSGQSDRIMASAKALNVLHGMADDHPLLTELRL